jgi:hypothetical protein
LTEKSSPPRFLRLSRSTIEGEGRGCIALASHPAKGNGGWSYTIDDADEIFPRIWPGSFINPQNGFF